MKKYKIYIYALLTGLLTSLLYSCNPDDNEKEWGLTKVYMPQAAVLNNELHEYPVPFDNNSSTYNYKIDSTTNTLKIILGVYRSGLQKLNAFSVKVNVDQEATANAVTGISKGIELPSDVYTLPTEASVLDGERESIFYLEVNLNKLIADYPNYSTKKMVLVVAISDPTRYELNPDLAKTTVVIDGSSFMPTPKIVQGGDFGTDSEQYWTKASMQGNLPSTAASINNGALIFDYGTTPQTATGEMCYYNAVQLENGKDYKFSCDFKSTGGSSVNNCWVSVTISSKMPVAGSAYSSTASVCNMFLSPWTTSNKLTSPIDGMLPQNAGGVTNINQTTGVFKATTDEPVYIVIDVVVWSGSTIGTMTFDNVKIEEQ